MKRKSYLTICLTLLTSLLYAKSEMINLSGEGWKVMLDPEASWQDDKLYLPCDLPKSLSELPINPPTDRWESLDSRGKNAKLPLTMEEYFSKGVNTYTTHGVSWAWRNFTVPKSLKGDVLLLNVEKTRMRAEIYINQKLAAYDVVGETPYSFDISKFVNFGKSNQIAIRITNPGGRRGWLDQSTLMWGEHRIASSGKDFSTIGNVEIEVNPQIYIDDVFVKNILPVNSKKIEVAIDIINKFPKATLATIPISVLDKNGEKVKEISLSKTLNHGLNSVKTTMTIEEGELWSPDKPMLYTLNAAVESSLCDKDVENQIFGLRTFEVIESRNGGSDFYLNGKRFFFKTSIDWGYYAPTGDYATQEMAQKSVEAAKSMNQNGLSFHRNIGEPLVMDYADSLGLCIYEEPGGFHTVKNLELDSFTIRHLKEKIRRMVIRDRNHPSVIIYSLSNEKNEFHDSRKEALEMINELDDSRLIINTSGSLPVKLQDIAHIRPYQSEIRMDFRDEHTAENRSAIYGDSDFYQEIHRTDKYNTGIYFLGEVNSVSGPDNWYRCYEDMLSLGENVYCSNIYKENHDKIDAAFKDWSLSEIGSKNIKTPEDVSMQAGRGMMYAHARHAQSIMCNDIADGFALNGWSPGPQTEGDNNDWSSAIVDQGRNIKAPAESFTYWVRPLQISLSRKNGRYFNIGDTVIVESNLINQAVLPKGKYEISYKINDLESGKLLYSETKAIAVKGGETFAQPLGDISFVTGCDWSAGYVTLTASLTQNGKEVANGSEQILLQNRASYKDDLKGVNVRVVKWNEAEEALKEAGANTYLLSDKEKCDIIVAGDIAAPGELYGKNEISSWERLDQLLSEVESGATMIVRFDKNWADVLYRKKILSKAVVEWGGNQTTQWLSNGWGYLDHFVGYNSTANRGTLGTTSWEFPSDPVGFYPFESEYKLSVYGLYFARPWLCKIAPIGYRVHEVQPTIAVTLGVIDYGKGKIIVNPCYWVDDNNAFNDMLFFNMIRMTQK